VDHVEAVWDSREKEWVKDYLLEELAVLVKSEKLEQLL